jgi:hypothetical protein
VFGRVSQDRFLFDLRTVFPHQDAALIAATEANPSAASSKAANAS